LARERVRQVFQPVQFDADRILAEAGQHVLAQQEHGGGCHGEDREQDGGEQAVADREFQGGGGLTVVMSF
jgi:mono/diheme cytochrome c family protein